MPSAIETPPTNGERKYLLNRDHSACVRLNFQQYVWKKELGFNIHPSIKVPENARIADIASGTSIWATEVAQEHPTSSIDCLELATSQAPPQAWLPENVRLHQWDMFDPNGPPAGLDGTFDIVHVRLVILAFENDASPLIRNLYKLLKPGGYLQWDENNARDYQHVHPVITDPVQLAEAAPNTSRGRKVMEDSVTKDWILQLPKTLESSGFTGVTEDTYAVDRLLTKWTMDSLIMVWDEVLDQTPTKAPERALYSQLLQGIKVEAADGHAVTTGKAVIVAKKEDEQA